MRKLIPTLFLLFVSFHFLNAQTVFWSEDFEGVICNPPNAGCSISGYSGTNGLWTETFLAGHTGDAPNVWYVSCMEAGFPLGGCGNTCVGASPPPPPPAPSATGQSLHLGSTLLGDIGAAYNAGSGVTGLFDGSTETRAESPVIDCSGQNTIVLTFNYVEFGDGAIDDGSVWYFDGVSWSLLSNTLKTTCCLGLGIPALCTGIEQGQWGLANLNLPASANNNPNVKIGFLWQNDNDGVGIDPSYGIDNIVLTANSGSNTVSLNNLPAGPFCEGQAINFNFTSSGTFPAGNDYQVIMSDASGVFVLPPNIVGTLTSSLNSGVVNVTIPVGTPAGTGYQFNIIATNPATVGSPVGPFTIDPVVPVSVSISVAPNDTVCAGAQLTFTAVSVNGGAAPTYQWQNNGVNIPGATNATLVTSTLLTGANIRVILNSSFPCTSNDPDTSNVIPITILPTTPLTATIAASPTGTICAGDLVAFTSTVTNGGTTPVYQWLLNGNVIPGANADTYNTSTLNDQDTIQLVVASSNICATNSPDTTNFIITTVISSQPATIIALADTLQVCSGGTVNFSSTSTNGGPSPTYQWYVDGLPIATGINSTFSTTFTEDAIVYVSIQSSLPCVPAGTTFSDSIFIDVVPIDTLTIGIAPTTGICAGQNVLFLTYSPNAGVGATYIWTNNGDTIGSGSTLSIPANSLATGDEIICTVTATNPCINVPSASSPVYNVVLLPFVDVDAGPNVEITYGDTTTLTPVITGGVINALGFTWFPDSSLSCRVCKNPTSFALVSTWYILEYTSTNGCKGTDSVLVDVKPNYEVFVPSAFSPNGDGRNDVLYARGPFIKDVTMKIYDRFGQMIFESPYIIYGWDGTKNFVPLNSGVYVYLVDGTFLDGTTFSKQGTVTLAR
jgi:gliding motility-associated-like protein